MSDYQNFAILVTRTSVVSINVLATDRESATRQALSQVGRKGYAHEDVRTEPVAVWPQGEPEDDFIIPTERGYEVRRGWFWEASLDFNSFALTSAQVWAANPDADARDMKTFRRVFDPYVTPNNTLFSINKRYGFATRFEGDARWSNVVNTQAQAEREARHELQQRAKRKRDADFAALLAETIERMKAPGNGNALLRVRGGRWTVKNELAERDPAEVEDQSLAWSVPPSVPSVLIDQGKVNVLGRFTRSQTPFHVGLSDAVLRPF